MLFKRILQRILIIIGILKMPLRTRTVYISLCALPSDSLVSVMDEAWLSECIISRKNIPDVPYLKIQLKLLEINPLYKWERKK